MAAALSSAGRWAGAAEWRPGHISSPCREEVIRTPGEGAESVFPADSLERKVITVISSSKSLVY